MHMTLLSPAPATAAEPGPPQHAPSWSMPLWAAVLVAGAAGFLLNLGSPPVEWWPLTFVSVTLALLTLIGRNIGGALLAGAVFGTVFFTTHLVWVGSSSARCRGLPSPEWKRSCSGWARCRSRLLTGGLSVTDHVAQCSCLRYRC